MLVISAGSGALALVVDVRPADGDFRRPESGLLGSSGDIRPARAPMLALLRARNEAGRGPCAAICRRAGVVPLPVGNAASIGAGARRRPATAAVSAGPIRSGDSVLIDPSGDLVIERLPRPEVEDLILESFHLIAPKRTLAKLA